jgi:subtilase family serine protease
MRKSNRPLPGPAALLCAAAFMLLTISGQAQQKLQTLNHHVRPAVLSGQAVPVGFLPATERLQLAIMLPLRNQTDLTSLLDRLNDPTSPDYGHFLTVAQFTDQFGPTKSDYQAVVNFAKANGFTVTGTSPNRVLVDINGSVAQVEKAFHVVMTVYQHPTENRTFYSPDREPSLNLSVPITRIAGLNNFSIPRPMIKKRPVGEAIHGDATGSGPQGAFRPSDMRAAYYGSGSLTGAGQSVGMLEFDGYNVADVTGDEGGVTYTVPITNILLDGASAASDGDDGEQALDIAQSIGMAPGLTSVRVYIAPITSAIGVGDVDIFNRMATDNISKQLSCSWGWSPDDIADDDPIFQEFAAQGQNLFVASGDSGKYTGSNSRDSSYPAEDVFVVAVGGTDLTTNGAGGPWEAETAWVDSSGGPADDKFAIPSWQVGVANSSNKASSTIRDVPDVAAEANFDNILCDDGTCTDNETGGTSYAAPRWAGYLALANQQNVANHGTTLGFLNPLIYPIGFGTNYNANFHDITSGSNGDPAVTGYDMVTGWGSPNGPTLINTLTGATTPSFTLSDSPGSLTITQGGASGTSTITVTDVGGFTGSVTLAASGLPSGVTATFGTNPTTGTSVLTLTASGTATTGTSTVTIKGTSGSLTTNTTLALTVNAVASPNFTIGASPASLTITQGANGASTITITSQNSFSSATTLSATGLPSGVTAAFSTNPVTPAANGRVTSTLTLTASATATVGAATVIITGTSGSLTHSTTIALTVNSSGGTKNFTIAVSPSSLTIDQGGSGSVKLTITSQNGFNSAVTLSANAFPSGVSATATANPVTPPANGSVSVTITFSASRRAALGTTTIELIGTSGTLTHNANVSLTVAR